MCSVDCCSVNDDIASVNSFSRSCSSSSLANINCRKCREQPAQVVLRLKDAYCSNCHLLSVNHKFRACLGKSKLIRPGEKVLIACSGSMSCATLLDLISCGLSDTTPKRLMFNPVVLFIDEGSVLNMSHEERYEIIVKVKSMLSKYLLQAYYVSLESICNTEQMKVLSFDDNFSVSYDKHSSDKIIKMFEDMKSFTAKEDLLIKLRQDLLLEVAKSLNCAKIFTAENGTNLAVKLISNLAIGRGAHLALDSSFCDSRLSSIYTLRPLQDVNMKEIAFYVTFKKLDYVFIPSFSTLEKKNPCSIQKLTENFLVGLQSEYSSTMSTVFRTGEKLSVNSRTESSGIEPCELCQAPLDISTDESTAFQATQFSAFVSKVGKAAVASDGKLVKCPIPETRSSTAGVCLKNDFSLGVDEVASTLLNHEDIHAAVCYGCQLTLKEVNNLNHLPQSLKKKILLRSNQAELKDKIKELLID